jgi:fructose/tagatose bisphosphate aldolase
MECKTVEELLSNIEAAIDNDGIVKNEAAFREEAIDVLVYNAVLALSEDVRCKARALIRTGAKALGVRSDSIQGLYEAMGRGEASGFTVPAINIRGLTFDTARAVFRAAAKNDSGAFIFEIAKSEIGYTEQRPDEYSAVIIAAALKEGYKGPVFIQGDHFQVNAAKYKEDPDCEIASLKSLIKEGIEGEFYNIDIDASTVVDLSKPSVQEEQEPNYKITAELTSFIRSLEPAGMTVSVGGEIGEVGKKNSTEEELRAFMDGLNAELKEGVTGISKISIQTGTAHGGVVMPDGSIASVKVDFDIIEKLTKVSREVYGLSGVVQHGASTLPDDAFHVFPERGASEVHLATGFQNMIYDSASFPSALKDEIYAHLKDAHKAEWKDDLTEEQFIYKTRKKGFGPFKKKMWDLPIDIRESIGKELEDRFDMLFKNLRCVDNTALVKKFVA